MRKLKGLDIRINLRISNPFIIVFTYLISDTPVISAGLSSPSI